MAAGLPDGAKLFLGVAFGTEKSTTVVTNGKPPVVTAAGHGFDDGDFVIMRSGWNALNERVTRVNNADTSTFEIEGINTANATNFPAGSGVGGATEITQWQQIDQVLEFNMSGGEQQYVTFAYLEEDFERNLPSVFSARTIEVRLADDPNNLGFQALQELEGQKLTRPLRVELPNGSTLLYNGTVSFSSTPTLSKGEVMSCPLTFSLQGQPTRL